MDNKEVGEQKWEQYALELFHDSQQSRLTMKTI
jgi:hypothetical protein